ncbi:MAG: NDP-sugar synthase [Myxococcota bacterium]|nr:NDP-sugar synthase [Myxococcota bacterium]MEC8425289.1 NDP-sugar synthase [Myxococcota bacterium]
MSNPSVDGVAPPATAFLLAAGLGTRLRPLTLDRPKPLMPLCGVPMLDHALALCRQHGHANVLVNAHWLWEQVAAWAVSRGVGLQVEQPEVLGTGGGLKAARGRLAERFVVVNGDILCDIDLTSLLDAVPEGGSAMALRADPTLGARAPVDRDAEDVVVRMRDFAGTPGVGLPGTHFTGVHAADRDLLSLVPDGHQCIVRTAYTAVLPSRRVRSMLHAGAWVDIGTPDQYLAANLAVLDGTLPTPFDVWSEGERGPGGSWVGVGATIGGGVQRSIIGAGATVPSGAVLRDCVVWDGVSVPAGVHESMVFHDSGALAVAR